MVGVPMSDGVMCELTRQVNDVTVGGDGAGKHSWRGGAWTSGDVPTNRDVCRGEKGSVRGGGARTTAPVRGRSPARGEDGASPCGRKRRRRARARLQRRDVQQDSKTVRRRGPRRRHRAQGGYAQPDVAPCFRCSPNVPCCQRGYRFALEARKVGGARWPRVRQSGWCQALRLASKGDRRWSEHAAGSARETGGTDADGQWWNTYIRVGEAKNPGPPQGTVIDGAVRYRCPEQQGFWHQSLPSPGAEQGDRDDEELLALAVDTVNATSWGPLSRYLLTTSAHVLLCQEHHLPPRDVPTAAAFALRHGWQPMISPAEPG